jgi:DNA-binding MarR family transcriptional regulator
MPVKTTVSRLAGILELSIRLEKVVRSFDVALAAGQEPMTYLDFRSLGSVLCFGPISLKQAADSMEVPKTTMHYILGKLEVRGLIQRAPARRKGTPVFTATEAGKEAWGRGLQALFRGTFGSVLGEQTIEVLESSVEKVRSLWAAAGASAQNEPIKHESMLLAVVAAEYLLQEAARGGDTALFKPVHSERRTFLT